MDPDRKFYVYAHFRESDGQIFYVGKGCGNRLGARARRSKEWQNVVCEHGYKARKISGLMPAACALSYEKAVIAAIGLKNLANIAKGGAGWGLSGYKWNKEAVQAKSQKCMKRVINSEGQVFLSLKDAAIAMRAAGHVNATESHISSCCNGKRHVAYGYSWSFNIEQKPELKDPSWFANEGRRRRVKASNGMVFESVSCAASWIRQSLKVKCGTSDISRCCNGRRNLCGGLSWSYCQ